MTRRISARLACTGKCAGRKLDFRRMVYVRDDGPDGVLRMEIR